MESCSIMLNRWLQSFCWCGRRSEPAHMNRGCGFVDCWIENEATTLQSAAPCASHSVTIWGVVPLCRSPTHTLKPAAWPGFACQRGSFGSSPVRSLWAELLLRLRPVLPLLRLPLRLLPLARLLPLVCRRPLALRPLARLLRPLARLLPLWLLGWATHLSPGTCLLNCCPPSRHFVRLA